jgi:hypothetical protein
MMGMARRFPSLKTLRAKWEEPTTRTIKIPSIQTIVLIVLLVGAMTAILWVSIAVQGEAPQPPAAEPPTPEGPATWLSAWSTFWGAIAGGIGAIGTAGALLIAAFSYKHQVDEKARQARERRLLADENRRAADERRRAQATKVSILKSESKVHIDFYLFGIHNGSDLPIKNVLIRCFDHRGIDSGQNIEQVIAGGMSKEMMLEKPRKVVDKVWATFDDALGQKWKVHINGDLERG